jgi:hypothetical protein
MPIERNNSFHLLLSDDELKLLKLLAEREGLNASDYLRTLIRTMPTTQAHTAQQAAHAVAARAVFGGDVDMGKLFSMYADAARLAKANAEQSKKKKAK